MHSVHCTSYLQLWIAFGSRYDQFQNRNLQWSHFTIVIMHETALPFFFFFSRSKIPARNIMHTVPRVPELCIATIVIDEKPRAHFPGPSKLQFAQKGTRYGATATTANRIRRYGAPQPKLKFFHLVTKSAEIILRAAIHWVRNSSVVIVHWGQRDKRRIRFTPDRRILDPLLVKVRAAYRSSLFGY